MDLKTPETLEEWNAAGQDYLPGTLGMVLTRVDAEGTEARLELRKGVMSWNGFLHGGTVVAIADTCCGYGTVASLPEGATGFTTVDLSTNFLGTALKGTVTCRAKPLHKGRTTQVWDAQLTAENNPKVLAHFRCTQLILWPR
ncbi:MAG: PaaI family thioesterase [Pseudomonadota bacterium]